MHSKDHNVEINLRPATIKDLQNIIDLDARVSGFEKEDYWRGRFSRLDSAKTSHIIVAEASGSNNPVSMLGFIVGEVRAWEFGSRPCGWIFAIGVSPDYRVQGIGEKLFTEICKSFKTDGANSVRTMIARSDKLNMSFFRAQGMMGGPFIELEKSLH